MSNFYIRTFFFLAFWSIWLIVIIYNFIKYEDILSNGVKGKGIVFKYSNNRMRGDFYTLTYQVEIRFYINEEIHTLVALDRRYLPAIEKEKELDIIYYNKYSENIIICGCDYKRSFLLEFYIWIISSILIIILSSLIK